MAPMTHPLLPMKLTRSVFVLLAFFCGQTFGAEAAAAPLKIERGVAQLFVDDFLIESQQDLKRTLHQPVKDHGGNEPVIALEKEYGEFRGTLQANGTIVFDPRLKKYVMFALGFTSHAPATEAKDRVRIYRFTSPDGMKWSKGDDGTPQQIEIDRLHPETKALTNTDLFSCCYDAKDAAHPYKGWLYFAHWGEELDGVYYVESADGKKWERGAQIMRTQSRVIEQDGRTLRGPGDVTTLYHDTAANRFLGLIKFSSAIAAGPGNRLRSRGYVFTDRLDAPLDLTGLARVELVPAAAATNGDQPHDEYYGSTAWRYESVWLGGLKVWHGGGDYPYSAAGCAFLKLAVSRDGLHWKKVPFANEAGVPEVFIANGADGGNGGRNDGGYLTEFSQGPLRIGNELIYYYGCSSFGKNHPNETRVSGGGIFRARLRPDGFVSVDAGSLTTKPLQCEGDNLFVNGVGSIAVELLDGEGKALGSAKISGDSLRHQVVFSGESLRKLTRGDGVRLRFTVKDGGRLYSFAAR